MDIKVVKLLEDIKWLLVLQLQTEGISSKDIAKTLGVDPAVIGRKIPRRKQS